MASINIKPTNLKSDPWGKNPSELAANSIDRAAKVSGLPASFFRSVAKKESNFNPSAVNRGTKASGLFQLLPSTSRSVQKRYSREYDFSGEDSHGTTAGLLAKENKRILDKSLNRSASPGDMMGAWHLGTGGYLKAMANRGQEAASVFPVAAKYDRRTFAPGRSVDDLISGFHKQASAYTEPVRVAAVGRGSRSPTPTRRNQGMLYYTSKPLGATIGKKGSIVFKDNLNLATEY